MTFLEETTKFSNFEVFFYKYVFNRFKIYSDVKDLKWSRGQNSPVGTGKPGFDAQ
jgi:hypothetical protein